MSSKITFSLASDSGTTHIDREQWVGKMTDVIELNNRWQHRLNTVLDEMVNNAIEHGSHKGASVDVIIEACPKGICITVSDYGGEHTRSAKDIQASIEKKKQLFKENPLQTDIRGRGHAMIITRWMDEMKMFNNKDGGITVTVTKSYEDGVSKKLTHNGSQIF
jgi:anti-sigma regulatory factor (Ser/Thr protein kinase)